MAEFESWKQFGEFSWFVQRQSRHILDAKNQRFLNAVVETSAKRTGSVQKDAVLWRAQLGNAWRTERMEIKDQEIAYDVAEPFPPERMTPLRDRANEGRVNPKGIPCLYCSTDMETAMTETRPWIGSYISVAQFVMLKDLTVVDCSEIERLDSWKLDWHLGLCEPKPEQREECVWGGINRAFSQPVSRNDDVAEYAPTQIMAEAFRSAGYDGIVYGSKLGFGKNVALFDLAAAELANCHLYQVDGVNLKFSTAANPYFMPKYCETDEKKETGAPGKTTDGQATQGEN